MCANSPDDILIFDETDAPDETSSGQWKILIVDDEEDVHTITRLALKSFRFMDKTISFYSAYSAEESRELLREHDDFAIILLDVVMETSDAGLQLIKYIRSVINNQLIRIILRTGQPGSAPERKVVDSYDINDYKTKTELTSDKLYTVVLSGIKTYWSMFSLEEYKANLEDTIKQRTREIEEQKKDLVELNATKDKFFSIIAHDLKNPIGAHVSMLDTLDRYLDRMKYDEIKRLVKSLDKSARYTFNLLENLLWWARSQTGKFQYEPGLVKLWLLVRANINLLRANAAQKSIEVKHDIPAELSVYADEHMIDTVVRNLLSNAIKFTSEGGRITISAITSGEMAEIMVTDNGTGISTEDIDKLFRIDTGFTRPGTSNEKGTGLGLVLCKDFIEKNNGRISVISTPGEGSVFKVALPLYK